MHKQGREPDRSRALAFGGHPPLLFPIASASRLGEECRELPLALAIGSFPSPLVTRVEVDLVRPIDHGVRPAAPRYERETDVQSDAVRKADPSDGRGARRRRGRMVMGLVDLGRQGCIHDGFP